MKTGKAIIGEDAEIWQEELQSEESPQVFRKALRLLRVLGVMTLVIAAFLYVMRDVADGSLLGGYYTFLGFTTLVAVGGWVAARKWKDSAGGRALLGMGAALLPAHMAQHGGFLLGHLRGDPGSNWYVGGGALSLLILLSYPVLLLTTWLGYSAWLRREAKILAPLYILTNLALLIPVRDGSSVVLVGLGMALPCFALLGWLRRGHEVMGSLEGVLARVAFVPAFALLVGRGIMNGTPTMGLVAFAVGLLGVFLYYTVARELQKPLARNWLRLGGVVLLGVAWFVWMWEQLWVHGSFFLPSGSDGLMLVLWMPPIVAGSLMLLYSAAGETRLMRRVLGWIGVGVLSLAMFNDLSLFQAGLSLIVGALALMGAYVTAEKWLLRVGMIAAGIGIVSFAILGFEQVKGVSWMVLAVVGLVLVMGVSYLESRGGAVMRWIRSRMDYYRDWE